MPTDDSVNNQPTPQPPAVVPPITNIPEEEKIFQTVTTNISPSPSVEEVKPKSKKKLILLIITILFVLILGALATGTYLIAYGKIKLKDNSQFQLTIGNFVMGLPFTPKTPKYLLTKSIMEQEKISSNSFDVSMAIKTDQADVLGISQFEVQLKGSADYQNPKDIKTSFNLSFTKDFNMDFLKLDKFAYFKVNIIPKALINLIGLDASKLEPLINQWISYDTSALGSQAGKYLNDQSTNLSPQSEKSVVDSLNTLFDEQISKEIKVTSITAGGINEYKITLSASDNLVNYIDNLIQKDINKTSANFYVPNNLTPNQKASDVLKKLNIEVYIDKNSYFMRKFVIAFDIVPNQKLSEKLSNQKVLGSSTSALSFLNSKISFAIVGQFDDFGNKLNLTVPANAITFEDFTIKISNLYPEIFAAMNPSTPALNIPQTSPTPNLRPLY